MMLFVILTSGPRCALHPTPLLAHRCSLLLLLQGISFILRPLHVKWAGGLEPSGVVTKVDFLVPLSGWVHSSIITLLCKWVLYLLASIYGADNH